MKGKCFLIATCLILSTFGSQAFGWEFVGTPKTLKLSSLETTTEGVEFTIKFKKDLTPLSECKNQFLLPNTHAEYNLLAAFLLTASAQKKKVGISFDETSNVCAVEIESVVLY